VSRTPNDVEVTMTIILSQRGW